MERTLSQNEAKIVLDLEWRQQKTVTLAELHSALGASQSYTRYLAHRLVKKGWFERLRPGLFQLVPAERGREGIADTNPLTVGAVLITPYFFSFGTACTHHGFTEQVFVEVYMACLARRRTQIIREKRYVFVRVPKARFFGFHETTVLGQPVQMAAPGRALLDAIDRPRYAGGVTEVSQITARAAARVSWDTLVEFAHQWDESALVQRLGYFLDLHKVEVPPSVRTQLLGLLRPNSKIHLGSRRKWGTAGKLARPWNVVENVPRDILTPRGEQPRRRVVFQAGEKNL